MSVPADGRFRVRVPVRFRDLDPMGHAHHTLPLIYLEEARAAFWRMLKGSAALDVIDYVMAEVTVRFHGRIRFPSDVLVGLAVRRVGGKSFTTDFEIRSETGALLAEGSAVQVAYDYAAERSKPIEAADRAVLEQWRDAAQNSRAMPADASPISPPST
ncbi:MAG TPA: thioesterase family protein [Longimicrobiales bacterium]